jgi:hypothetical protein
VKHTARRTVLNCLATLALAAVAKKRIKAREQARRRSAQDAG